MTIAQRSALFSFRAGPGRPAGGALHFILACIILCIYPRIMQRKQDCALSAGPPAYTYFVHLSFLASPSHFGPVLPNSFRLS